MWLQVDLYSVEEEYTRVKTLRGASSFITHLDWTNDSRFIQINSGAGERLIYDVTGIFFNFSFN